MGNSKSSFKRLQLSQFKLNSLLEITLAINGNLSTHDLLYRYEKILREDLNIGRIVIFCNDGTHWKTILETGIGDEDMPTDQSIIDTLSQYNAISYIASEKVDFMKGFDFIVPVFHKDTAVAYVMIGDIDEEQEGISPTIKHLHFIQTITNIIVVAIENKRLYSESLKQEALKRELELASKMQTMLIPSINDLPQTDSIKTAAYYSPHSEVGGDYYDFIKLSDTEYGFCIGDVSGKGISAAILMSNFQANLRALFKNNSDLKDIVSQLNELVMKNANGEKFITFFVAKYNTETRELIYINAGHNPPIINRASQQKIEYLTKGCMGLGMFDEIPKILFDKITMDHGDKLLLYTDGLVEAENDEQKEFGTIPVESCMSSDKSISDIVTMLIHEVHHFLNGNSLGDDITLLGIDFL